MPQLIHLEAMIWNEKANNENSHVALTATLGATMDVKVEVATLGAWVGRVSTNYLFIKSLVNDKCCMDKDVNKYKRDAHTFTR